MSVALHLYQQLRDAPDDDSRAKAIAEAFERLEERYLSLKDLATQSGLRETELRLQKEVREFEVKLKETEARLQREIKEVEVRLTQTVHRQTYWVIGSVGTIIGFIRLLDWLLASLPK